MGKKLENMKEQEIWLAQLPEYMGYGLYVVGTSEKEAMRILKASFYSWKRENNGVYSFPKAWDYFGGSCEKVELNKCFDSGFGGY